MDAHIAIASGLLSLSLILLIVVIIYPFKIIFLYLRRRKETENSWTQLALVLPKNRKRSWSQQSLVPKLGGDISSRSGHDGTFDKTPLFDGEQLLYVGHYTPFVSSFLFTFVCAGVLLYVGGCVLGGFTDLPAVFSWPVAAVPIVCGLAISGACAYMLRRERKRLSFASYGVTTHRVLVEYPDDDSQTKSFIFRGQDDSAGEPLSIDTSYVRQQDEFGTLRIQQGSDTMHFFNVFGVHKILDLIKEQEHAFVPRGQGTDRPPDDFIISVSRTPAPTPEAPIPLRPPSLPAPPLPIPTTASRRNSLGVDAMLDEMLQTENEPPPLMLTNEEMRPTTDSLPGTPTPEETISKPWGQSSGAFTSGPMLNRKKCVLRLSGSGCVRLGSASELTIQKSLTLEVFCKPDKAALTDICSLIMLGSPYKGTPEVFLSMEAGQWQAGMWFGSNQFARFPVSQPSERWFHIACTYDGTKGAWSLYVDGELKGTKSAPLPLQKMKADEEWCIGAQGNGQGRFFLGLLSEVRIWETVRSKSQLKAGAKARLTGQEPGLLAVYPLDDCLGTVASDVGPFIQNGELQGDAKWEECTDCPFAFV